MICRRPKSADRFNTQPPEGGWTRPRAAGQDWQSFNTQPPEGGWRWARSGGKDGNGFNTQPPEGGWLHTLRAYVP